MMMCNGRCLPAPARDAVFQMTYYMDTNNTVEISVRLFVFMSRTSHFTSSTSSCLTLSGVII